MNIEVERVDGRSIPPRWTIALVTVAAALAAGLIFVGLGGETSDAPSPTTLASISQVALEDQVPEFTGTLHATLNFNRHPTYLRWEASAEAPELISLDAPGMRFNVDLSQVAAIDFIGNVHIGPPGETEVITPDVTSFAWHDTDPLLIALTRTLDSTSLWFAQIDPDIGYVVVSVASVPPGSEVVAFGEWGYAFHSRPDSDGNRTTLLVDASGEEIERVRGVVTFVLPGPEGGVLVADPLGTEVTATWGAEKPVVGSVNAADGLLRVLWSDDLASYAELSDGDQPNVDVLFVNVTTPTASTSYTLEGAVPYDWDPSGRFLAGVLNAQIVILDTADGMFYDVGIPASLISDVRLSG